MIVLDTNVISDAMKPSPHHAVDVWLRGLDVEVAISAITMAELLAGIARLPEGERKRALSRRIDAVLDLYRGTGAILPFDEAAAAHYAEILVARDQAGSPISTADAQIAAICRAHGATCATRNVKGFVHTGVELINPWEHGSIPR